MIYLVQTRANVVQVTAGPSQYDLNTQKSSMSRKRSLREEKEGEDDPDAMDTLFPGAAAMKRRKLQQELENSLKLPEVPSERSPPESLETESAKPAVKGKKGKKENPFLVAARANLEEEEEEERKKFQDLNLNDEELEMIKFIRNPGIVEVVGIRSRETPRAEAHGDEGSRWNPKWNGRANFKRFKRAGASAAMRTVRGAVIVGLVEHKSQADRVFMEGDKMATQRTQARDTQLSRGRGGGSPPLANDSDSEDSLEEITAPVRAGRRLASESSQTISGSSNTTRAASVVTGKGKRTVASNSNSAAEKEPKAKRQRTFLLKHDSSDSSEDELKFRFKRK